MIDNPSENEEEYFKLQELRKIRELRKSAAVETVEKEKKRLKELHWMRCPKCGLELAEVEYKQTMVDACFACGGLFLDGGEIERILAEQKKTGESTRFGRFVSGLFGS